MTCACVEQKKVLFDDGEVFAHDHNDISTTTITKKQ
ncbi:hypothetical protein T01_9522 [Trichinella spiralis]|uniref:Uncharacterized protein n=1 Tax=Trichinella spiralis TaxID=6334 RepID=A0A0V0Z110_TRISP|nr:hypothetical protein T01_9522 [Trichinella spiralis]